MKLVEIILDEMKNVSKSQKKFFILLMQTIVSMYGRITFRSLARYSDTSEKTFRRWFKKAFDFCEFNSKAVDKVISSGAEAIAAFDPTFMLKAGNHTWGKDYFWNGGKSKTEKGLEISLCALIDISQNTAYAINAEQTPSLNEIKEKGDIESNRIDFYLSHIAKVKDVLLKYTQHFVADSFFTKFDFVEGIIKMRFSFVGKLRKDANLKKLYRGEQKKGRGRPKIFVGKCNMETLEDFELVCDLDENTKLYSGTFYHVSLKREIKVIPIITNKNGKIGKAFLFATDITLNAFKIVEYYKARFQIEFLFRDAKQHTGLGDCQSRDKESLGFHCNASFTAVNLIKIEEQLTRLNAEKKIPFSMTNHKARYHNESLIGRFFSMLNIEPTLIKLTADFQKLVNYGTIFYRDS